MWIFIFAFILVLLLLLYMDCIKPVNFPPGPSWLPIIGSALSIHKQRVSTGMLCKGTMALAQQYKNNGALGFKIGKDKLVVAVSTDAMLEMMCNEDLDGRPTGPFFETRTWGLRRGILLVDEIFWQVQRRFIIRHLKEFGFARRGMADMIQNEAEHLLEDFRNVLQKQNGQAMIQMRDAFNVYILNTLWTMMAGVRYNQENKEVLKLQELLYILFTNIDMVGTLFSHFPFLRFLAPNFSGYNQFKDIHKRLLDFLNDELENHKKHFKMEDEPRDLMDVYLRAIYSDTEKNDSFSEKQLLAVCLDMFLAGSETTNKSIAFLMLHIIREPELQRKMQEEIDRVVGRERLPVLDDRPNMPYCEAAVLETVRIFMGYTFGIPHRALRDTTFRGYNIPKDTMLVCCFRGMLYDKNVWKGKNQEIDIYKFRPERFLKDGKVSIPERYYPFGVGKHRCMGELMARANIFLFTTTLLQNFNFQVPPNHPLPSDEPVDGATPNIHQYTALITHR